MQPDGQHFMHIKVEIKMQAVEHLHRKRFVRLLVLTCNAKVPFEFFKVVQRSLAPHKMTVAISADPSFSGAAASKRLMAVKPALATRVHSLGRSQPKKRYCDLSQRGSHCLSGNLTECNCSSKWGLVLPLEAREASHQSAWSAPQ